MGVILTNQDVAILMKVNELAARYGIKPHEFIAEVTVTDDGITRLNYTTCDDGTKMEPMVSALAAFGWKDGEMAGDARGILKALDMVLAQAPRSRIRHN
jgi:hypothetical protein